MGVKRMRVFAGPNGSGKTTSAAITKGFNVKIIDTNIVPNWFVKYLADNE